MWTAGLDRHQAGGRRARRHLTKGTGTSGWGSAKKKKCYKGEGLNATGVNREEHVYGGLYHEKRAARRM